MKASIRQQHLLIDLQEIDTELLRLDRRMAQLPEKNMLVELQEGHREAHTNFFEKQKALEDLQLQISRIESDVILVRERIKRSTSRLADSVSAKEATALQEELDTLNNRTRVLEDRELELMELAEEAESTKNEFQEKLAVFEAKQQELESAVVLAEKDVASKKARLMNERDGLSAEIQGDLKALYERTRARYGMGAAKLEGRISGGSNMELDSADYAKVKAMPDDEIYLCPVSGVILVRGYGQ